MLADVLVWSVQSHRYANVFGEQRRQRLTSRRTGYALVAFASFRDRSREETSAQEVTTPGPT